MAITIKTNHRQNTIEADSAGAGGAGIGGSRGTRNQASLNAIFSESPMYLASKIKVEGETDVPYDKPENLRDWYITNVVKGTVKDASYGLGTYDRDYGTNAVEGNPSPPDLEIQALEDSGVTNKPATGFVPNPTSPGEGSFKADTKPDAPDDFIKELKPNGAAFSGDNIKSRSKLIDQAQAIVDRLE
jgi:hypothetical protein|tara:strand:+ start:529 stop:1089 length:561 start_codon:yes stop_codon:yes gene_type:complete